MTTHFGPEVGAALQKLAEDNGIIFKSGQVASFEGKVCLKSRKINS